VRILIFHGYLLHGTGSNVYNANLAESLARAGHEVHLLCQDREAGERGWVDATGDWDAGALRVNLRREPARVTAYRPDIGGVLPVYVADVYEGFDARPFPDLSQAELARYLDANVEAVAEVARAVRPDVALANHLVMGPAILARALGPLEIPYAVKIHGSALEYTVKPHPRFLSYAREGLAGARGVLVGSRHTAESLWAAMDDPGLERRTRLGPPGVDVAAFAPREPAARAAGVQALLARLRVGAEAAGLQTAAGASSFSRDLAAAVTALERLDLDADRPVIFVGKLIGSKGVELLLAAWPLVLARVPEAKLVVVGFGGFRAGLERLVAHLASGDLQEAAGTRSETGAELPWLEAFLTSLTAPEAARYRQAASALPERVVWAGRLDHGELHDLLPAMEAMVVPSTFPEAFGMVAAEAAACGALPVVAEHSGLAEVARTLAAAVPEPSRSLLSFPVGPDAVRRLGTAVADWLEAPAEQRDATRDALVATARERYSWDGVARTVLAAARGALDDLPTP
jgi:glycosyltransferase involved in cell wall biosynthesis